MMPNDRAIGIIKSIDKDQAKILFSNKSYGIIPLQNALWARKKNK